MKFTDNSIPVRGQSYDEYPCGKFSFAFWNNPEIYLTFRIKML